MCDIFKSIGLFTSYRRVSWTCLVGVSGGSGGLAFHAQLCPAAIRRTELLVYTCAFSARVVVGLISRSRSLATKRMSPLPCVPRSPDFPGRVISEDQERELGPLPSRKRRVNLEKHADAASAALILQQSAAPGYSIRFDISHAFSSHGTHSRCVRLPARTAAKASQPTSTNVRTTRLQPTA